MTPEVPEGGCEILQASYSIPDPGSFLASLRSIAAAYNVAIVCFDANKMAGRAHVTSALFHAARSCREGRAIANSFEVEALLYAAGSRQCAIATGFGIHQGTNHSYIAVCPPSQCVVDALANLVDFDTEDWELMSDVKRDRLMVLFSITPLEIEVAGGPSRVKDLVLERVALLDVLK
jgi:KEOPS complex subunit Cgi121